MTAADSARLAETLRLRGLASADTSAAAVRARRQFAIDLPYVLKAAGALGTLVDGVEGARADDDERLAQPGRRRCPNLVIAHEDYAMLERQILAGASPRVEGRVENTIGRVPVQQWNTVAEIRGSERPGQVVILGAHLDSWDLGTGATDNGTGSMVVLEAARAHRPVGAQAASAPSASSCSAARRRGCWARAPTPRRTPPRPTASRRCWCSTTAPAPIRGQALQGRPELEELWRALLAPVATLGADSVRNASKSGTDHLSFLPVRRAGVQLRPAAPRLLPHPPLAERHLRQGGPRRPEAGRGGHGGHGATSWPTCRTCCRAARSASRRRCRPGRRRGWWRRTDGRRTGYGGGHEAVTAKPEGACREACPLATLR